MATGGNSSNIPTGNGYNSIYTPPKQSNFLAEQAKINARNAKNSNVKVKEKALNGLAKSLADNNRKLSKMKTGANIGRGAFVNANGVSGMNGGIDPNGSSSGDGGGSEEGKKKDNPKTSEELWEEQNG